MVGIQAEKAVREFLDGMLDSLTATMGIVVTIEKPPRPAPLAMPIVNEGPPSQQQAQRFGLPAKPKSRKRVNWSKEGF